MPSLRQPLPQVALVIDTSGSMSDTMLGQALGEVAGVLRSLGVARRNLRVIACDARAYRAQQVRDLGAIRLGGRGVAPTWEPGSTPPRRYGPGPT